MHGIDGGPLDKRAKPVAYPTLTDSRIEQREKPDLQTGHLGSPLAGCPRARPRLHHQSSRRGRVEYRVDAV